MFGAPRRTARKPLVKNRWLRTSTAPARRSCAIPIATWFGSGCVNQRGSGQPSIMCPIVAYISTARRTSDAMSRARSPRDSAAVSGRDAPTARPASGRFAEPSLPAEPSEESTGAAPYPAASTAATMAAESAAPSTDSSFVSRLAAHDTTPGTALTAFSTRAEQAAHIMPVTE